jgi:pSer/pThr/pTyr-binding forkhead associated (FHA) protein
VFDIPVTGLVIGRDPECDVVVPAKSVSRRHASIRPSIRGYVVTDLGANGTFVNGRRVDGSQVLGMRDVIRVGEEQFRFEADAGSLEPAAEIRAMSTPPSGAPPIRPPATPATGKLLATLEVISRGTLLGKRFRLERAVAHIGRNPDSDVRLDDDTVSGAHATLARRKTGWVLTDLESTNGTYVDGARLSGERHLPPTATELRFGGVKLVFRPLGGSGGMDATSTRAVVGVSSPSERKKR